MAYTQLEIWWCYWKEVNRGLYQTHEDRYHNRQRGHHFTLEQRDREQATWLRRAQAAVFWGRPAKKNARRRRSSE